MKLYFTRWLGLFAASLCLIACSPSVATPTMTTEPQPTATEAQPTAVLATVEPESSLEPGQWTFVFFHAGREQVVLVNGGPERGKPADDPLELWGWDGARWSLISADESGPAWRNWAAVAYDPDRNVLVVHGGMQTGENFAETWEWDGQSWTQFGDTRPGAREGALMAYDQAHQNMVLFGGSTPDMQIYGDTWIWEGQAWTQSSQSGPAARFPGGMVYDAARQEVLLYSGHFAASTGEFTSYDDLWAWDGVSWREIASGASTPGHRTHPGMVFDPVTEQVLLIGSGSDVFLRDVWAWDGSVWTEITTSNTPARSGHNVAYDASRDRFVLFGGVDRPGGRALADTWEWDRAVWMCVQEC